jgi:hypothetical protein
MYSELWPPWTWLSSLSEWLVDTTGAMPINFPEPD